MTSQRIRYEVIGRAMVEQCGGATSCSIKLIYRGDGTPWWTCSAGLELPVSLEMYKACEPGTFVAVVIETA